MNHTNAIFFVLATACLVLICSAFQPALPATLLFSDEFNAGTIDNSKWVIPGIAGPIGEPTQSSGYLHLDPVGAYADAGEELPAQKTDFTDCSLQLGLAKMNRSLAKKILQPTS